MGQFYMTFTRALGNLLRYGTTELMLQVDPSYMKPIVQEELAAMSSYSPKDSLLIEKPSKSVLKIDYSAEPTFSPKLSAVIYAQGQREGFDGADALSIMRVTWLWPEGNTGEVVEAVSRIVMRAGIERVIVDGGTLAVPNRDIIALQELRGTRQFSQFCKHGFSPVA